MFCTNTNNIFDDNITIENQYDYWHRIIIEKDINEEEIELDFEWWREYPRFFKKVLRLKSIFFYYKRLFLFKMKRWNKLKQKKRIKKRLRYKFFSKIS